MQDFTFAVRRYLGMKGQPLIDRMARKSCGSFVLIEGPEEPGGLEVERPYSAEQVFEWLREFPWQIERTVVAHCPKT